MLSQNLLKNEYVPASTKWFSANTIIYLRPTGVLRGHILLFFIFISIIIMNFTLLP